MTSTKYCHALSLMKRTHFSLAYSRRLSLSYAGFKPVSTRAYTVYFSPHVLLHGAFVGHNKLRTTLNYVSTLPRRLVVCMDGRLPTIN